MRHVAKLVPVGIISVAAAVSASLAFAGPALAVGGPSLSLSAQVAASQPDAKPAAAQVPPFSDTATQQQQASSAIDQIVQANTDASDYGGATADPATGTTTVYVTPMAYGSLMAAFPVSLAGLVKVVQVQNSLSSLDALTTQIASGIAAIHAAGISPTQWGPDIATNGIDMSVTGNVAAAQSYMDAHYGAGTVKVSASTDTFHADSGRWFDNAPFYSM